jgi:hypothetical protein
MECDLDEARAITVRMHLAECDECAMVLEDLSTLSEFSADETQPPNSQALWCRINNIIESEIEPPAPVQPPQRRFWQVSFGQLAAALLLIAIFSSLATVAFIRYYSPASTDDFALRGNQQTTVEKLLGRIGLIDSPQQARERRIKQQQAAIEYWDARVQARRAQWDRHTREAFDRNLQLINETVSEYTTILEQDPDDDLSGEMLDSVLTDKMNLLRDFSDL